MTRLLEKVSRRTEQVKKKHDVILSDATRDDGELCALCACERIRQVFAVGFFLHRSGNRCGGGGVGWGGAVG